MRNKRICLFVVLSLIATLLAASSLPVFAKTQMIIEDGGFEKNTGNWEIYEWLSDTTQFGITNETARTGSYSYKISSSKENDARIVQEILVEPKSYYTVRAYVKTLDVLEPTDTQYRVGATISVINTSFISRSIEGTNGWTELEFSFQTSDNADTVLLCFTLGGYGALNSGTVWFDDITVEKVDSRPDSCYVLPSENEVEEKVVVKEKNWAGYEKNDNPDQIKWMAVFALYFFLLSLVIIGYAKTGALKASENKITALFIIILAAAAIFRGAVAYFGPSYTYDTGLFKYWAGCASADLFGMYHNENISYLDYPPLYMYMLAPIGVLANSSLFGNGFSMLMLKLPSICADIISGILIFKFVKKYTDDKWAIVLSLFYVLNPMVWINSASWGQVDSIFAMLIFVMMTCIFEKKWIGTGAFFALSILLKPHGIIFTPAVGLSLLTELFREKKWKPMVKAVLSGLVTFVLLLLPFYIKTNFENPTWIIELYKGTVGNYNYATMNGFNFWAMIGMNLRSADTLFLGKTCSWWGTMGIVFACLLAVVLAVFGSRKNIKARNALPTVIAMAVLVTVFTFAHKMHERYMFAAVILAISAFVQTRDKSFLHLAVAFSLIVFINTYYVYDLHVMWTYPHPDFGDKNVELFGTIEFISFVWMLIVIVRVFFLNLLWKPKSLKALPDIVTEEKTTPKRKKEPEQSRENETIIPKEQTVLHENEAEDKKEVSVENKTEEASECEEVQPKQENIAQTEEIINEAEQEQIYEQEASDDETKKLAFQTMVGKLGESCNKKRNEKTEE